MVKRYVQTSGALVEAFNTFDGKPSGEWVVHDDYLVLAAALKEALDRWEGFGKAAAMDTSWPGWTRIAELRKLIQD